MIQSIIFPKSSKKKAPEKNPAWSEVIKDVNGRNNDGNLPEKTRLIHYDTGGPFSRRGLVETLVVCNGNVAEDSNVVVYFLGNFTGISKFDKLRKSISPDNTVTIVVNHPNVGESRLDRKAIHTMNDLYNSGQVVVDHLLACGVAPSKLTLHGHSLGGAVASRVARRCHHKNKPVKLVADRTLMTVPDFVMGRVLSLIWYAHLLLKPLVAAVLFPLGLVVCVIAAVLTRITGCHIAGSWDYYSVPHTHRRAIEVKEDGVMRPIARLSHSIFGRFSRHCTIVKAELNPDEEYYDKKAYNVNQLPPKYRATAHNTDKDLWVDPNQRSSASLEGFSVAIKVEEPVKEVSACSVKSSGALSR